jgi:hypothetical protein
MKTPKEFYEMHHPIDVGVETKEGCVKMMEGYAEYVLQQVKNLNIPAVVGRSKQLICPHCKSKNVTKWSDNELTCYDCKKHWAN